MKNSYIILSFILLFSVALDAQTEKGHHKMEKEKGIYEIIASGIYAYSFEHKEGAVGTEIHFTYWFNHKWGTGASYTAKFEGEEVLHDVALIGSMNPVSWLTLNAGLNFGLPGEHRELGLGAYTEAEINIRPSERFHFGPIFGAVLGRETEGTIGIHVGFEF